jgi:CubicO group peptidase (beta-lactamase class C family)
MRTLSIVIALAVPAIVDAQSASRASLANQLDSIARDGLDRSRVIGMSVAVMRGRDTLLNRGYGSADLALGVPASSSTTYRVIGPALATVVMQHVERGKLRLDDDVTAMIPEFPWQGKRVTLRQLMDATSGVPDFHYAGDPYVSTIGMPKSPDQVAAIVANQPFTHEPGAAVEWTITGLHLAGMLAERVGGVSYPDYLRRNVFAPAGLANTYYCDDASVTPGLGRAYLNPVSGPRQAPPQSASTYPYIGSVCSTAADAATMMRAMRDGTLMRRETYAAMTTAVPAAKNGPTSSRAIGLRIDSEDGHRWVGEFGNVLSVVSVVMDFPDDSLTVVALANTGSMAILTVARNLARAALNLPLIVEPRRTLSAPPTITEATPLTAAEQKRYVGTYRLLPVDGPAARRNAIRTYRVFRLNERLMIQPLGLEAEPLLHQDGHTFAFRGGVASFTVDGDRANALEIRGTPMLRGRRVAEESGGQK